VNAASTLSVLELVVEVTPSGVGVGVGFGKLPLAPPDCPKDTLDESDLSVLLVAEILTETVQEPVV
jgi:hypothetical protein